MRSHGTIRTSSADLVKRRSEGNCRVLLTGGTGFLGSHLAEALLEAGVDVHLLARPDKRHSARERVDRLLDWLGLGPGERRRLRVLEGSIDQPGLGLDPRTGQDLGESVDEIIHCASSTSFTERKRLEVEASNIQGLARILEFAATSRCAVFHHLSTAYVAGRQTGLCREDLADSGPFNNVYEETKARGERMVQDVCRREGIVSAIYRPSIVYGDSKTGRSLRFNAVYFPVKTVLFLKDIYEADIARKGGKRAEQVGVRKAIDGRLFMPLRLEVSDGSGLNLIPVDFFVSAFMALREERPDGGIFHIVNPRLKRIEDIIDYAGKRFGLSGIEPCRAEDFETNPRNALEVLYESYLEAYGPYMRDTKTFDLSQAGPVLQKRRIICPDFDYGVFTRCMEYAIEADWGSRLYPAPAGSRAAG
jgi:nucleoside-diphosphate-sugar epimerase